MAHPGRRLLLLVLALWTVWRARDPDPFDLLDNVNLAIHETGHLVFGWGGETLTVLGGTLFQLSVPLAFAVSFARRQDRFGLWVMVWWVAHNLGNIARYVADARAQELPLVGGGEHDWAFLLGEWDLLHRDQVIAGRVRAVGVLLAIAALALAWRVLPSQPGRRSPVGRSAP